MKDEDVAPQAEKSEESDAIMKNLEEAAAELGLNDDLKATEESPESLKKEQGVGGESKRGPGRPKKVKEELKVSEEPEEQEAGAESDEDEVQPEEEDEAGAEEESEEQLEGTEEEIEPEEESIEPPHFWDAEKKKLFAGASPKLQRAIVEDLVQHEEYRRELLTENQGLKYIAEGLQQISEPIAAEMQAANLDPVQSYERFVGWHRLMMSGGPQGLQHALTFLQRYGYDPQMIYQAHEERLANGYDPRVEEALERAEQAERAAKEFIAQQEQQQKAFQASQIQADIQAFKTERDAKGNLVRPHADFYEPMIAQVAAQMKKSNPQMQRRELLGHAYNFVMQQVEKVNGPRIQQTEKKKTEQVIKHSNKAKLASSVSLKGTPSNGKGKASVESVQQGFEEAWNELGLN